MPTVLLALSQFVLGLAEFHDTEAEKGLAIT